MADDRIEIEISLDDGSVQRGFAKIGAGAKKTGKDIELSFSEAIRKGSTVTR